MKITAPSVSIYTSLPLSTPSKQTESSECLPQAPLVESDPWLFFLPEWLWFLSFVMRDSNPVRSDYHRNGAAVKGHQVWGDYDVKPSSAPALERNSLQWWSCLLACDNDWQRHSWGTWEVLTEKTGHRSHCNNLSHVTRPCIQSRPTVLPIVKALDQYAGPTMTVEQRALDPPPYFL